MTKFRGYVGTYTKGDSKGVYTFTLDTETAALSEAELVAEIQNPTYLSIDRKEETLFVVAKKGDSGGVASYDINKETGKLAIKSLQTSPGSSPCHVSIDAANQTVVAAHYHRGTVEAYQIKENKLSPASIIQHEGKGMNPDRQEKPHVHFTGFTPDEKFVVAVDLGIDQIVTYEVQDDNLKRIHSLSVQAGSGPRHITFHPNGKFAYVMTELSNEVILLTYDAQNGSFQEQQYIRTVPADFTHSSQGSAIHITSDGHFVYAGNRGHNSIAVFAVNQDTGMLTFVENTDTSGNWPRDFMLDPTEKFMVVSNQESHNLVLFARDTVTGKLSKLNAEIEVPYPVCVKFLS